MGARHLDPASAIADEAQQARKARRRRAGARVGASHVVDHHRQAERLEGWNRVGQILGIDPQLQVPAELRHHGRKRARGIERDAAAIVQRAAAND
jgi:hypothetical protein